MNRTNVKRIIYIAMVAIGLLIVATGCIGTNDMSNVKYPIQASFVDIPCSLGIGEDTSLYLVLRAGGRVQVVPNGVYVFDRKWTCTSKTRDSAVYTITGYKDSHQRSLELRRDGTATYTEHWMPGVDSYGNPLPVYSWMVHDDVVYQGTWNRVT